MNSKDTKYEISGRVLGSIATKGSVYLQEVIKETGEYAEIVNVWRCGDGCDDVFAFTVQTRSGKTYQSPATQIK